MEEYVLVAAVVAAVVFAQVSAANTNTILALLFMMGATATAFVFVLSPKRSAQSTAAATQDSRLQAAIGDRREAYTDPYSIARFNKLRFLPQNPSLRAIAEDLRFVRTFDKARYGDLLLHMEKFQKTYQYILGERMPPRFGIHTLMDLRDAVLEIMYSLVFAVPATFRHTYGFLPYPVITQNTETFTALSRKMLQVVENFARAQGEPYVPPVAPKAHETGNGRAHRLP